MIFLISDTFTDSLARLTGEEQKAVKTSAFDLQLNLAQPGLRLHKLDRARDANFWSVRVSSDLRLIVHRGDSSLLLCYVDHHDRAYDWAARRKLVTHLQTGAAQLVEVREQVQDIVVPPLVDQPDYTRPIPKPALLAAEPDASLLAFGVPLEWLAQIKAADEDRLLELAPHLPAEAAEAVLELATGGRPQQRVLAAARLDPFQHPDAQRRFRVMHSSDELALALEYPWDKWLVFLHPDQRQLTERDYNGPARVAGSAGTGKTIVALHRAVFLARRSEHARVLLTTFSSTLSDALNGRLRKLIHTEPRLTERLEVQSIQQIGERLYRQLLGKLKLASDTQIDAALSASDRAAGLTGHSPRFLRSEWDEIVDAWQLSRWEDYRDVRRLGRKTRLPEAQRIALWKVFASVQQRLAADGVLTVAAMFHRLAHALASHARPPFEHAVVDEAQDLSIGQLRFLAAMAGNRSNGLFFAGDLGQRIFQTPFSWKSLGVNVRGRSRTLHVNYRTSHQIRQQADRLLDGELSDVDGEVEDRGGTVSVFNGPLPQVMEAKDDGIEATNVAQWLCQRMAAGVLAHEIGVFVRSPAELPRARAAMTEAKLPYRVLDEHVQTSTGQVSVASMHLAKGLEFRAVVVMALDDDVVPSSTRIAAIADQADLDEVYTTERHLLYVAITRAREFLLLSGVAPVSEFLQDLIGST